MRERRIRISVTSDVDRAVAGMRNLENGINRVTGGLKKAGLVSNEVRGVLDNLFKAFMVWKVTDIVGKLDQMRYGMEGVAKEGMKLYVAVENTFVNLGVAYGKGLRDWTSYEGAWQKAIQDWRMGFEEAAGVIRDVVETGGEWFLPFLHKGVLGLKQIYDVSFDTSFAFFKMSESFWQSGESMKGVIGAAMELVRKFQAPKAFVPAVMSGVVELSKMQKFLRLTREEALGMGKQMAMASMAVYGFTGDVREAVNVVVKAQQAIWDFQKSFKLFRLGIGAFPEEQVIALVRAFGNLGVGLRVMTKIQQEPAEGFRELLNLMNKVPGSAERMYLLLSQQFPELEEPLRLAAYHTQEFSKALDEATVPGLDMDSFIAAMRKNIMGTTAGQEKMVEVLKETKDWEIARKAAGTYRKELQLLQEQYERMIKLTEIMYDRTGFLGRILTWVQGKMVAFSQYGVRALIGGLPGGQLFASLVEITKTIAPTVLMATYAFQGLRGILGWMKGFALRRGLRGGGAAAGLLEMTAGAAAGGYAIAAMPALGGVVGTKIAGTTIGGVTPGGLLIPAGAVAGFGGVAPGAAVSAAAGGAGGLALGVKIAIGIGAVAAAFATLAANIAFLKNVIPITIRGLREWAMGIYGFKEVFRDIKEFSFNWARDFVNILKTPFVELWKLAKKGAKSLWDIVRGVLDPIGVEAERTAKKLGVGKDVILGIIKAQNELTYVSYPELMDALGAIKVGVPGILEGMPKDMEGIRTKVEEVLQPLAARWASIMDSLQERLTARGERLRATSEQIASILNKEINIRDVLYGRVKLSEKQIENLYNKLKQYNLILEPATEGFKKLGEQIGSVSERVDDFSGGLQRFGKELYSLQEVERRIIRARSGGETSYIEKLMPSVAGILNEEISSMIAMLRTDLKVIGEAIASIGNKKVELIVNGAEFASAFKLREQKEMIIGGNRISNIRTV